MDKSLEKKVVTFLRQLGIETDEALTYVYLLTHGPQTVLAISRGLKTGRTKLYPLHEDLAHKQLVIIHEKYYGTSYEAAPPETLEYLVAEKERLAMGLRSALPGAISFLKSAHTLSPQSSRIIEYQGIEGLKQMNWNLTKAEKSFYVFEMQNLSRHLGRHFADKIRSLFLEKGITSHDLTNDRQHAIETSLPRYQQVSKVRYIPKELFEIEFETYIYNNCVALLSYDRDDIFGVEIYNEKLARQQKRLFELLWKQATPLKLSVESLTDAATSDN